MKGKIVQNSLEEEFINEFISLRKSLGLTQRKLAEEAGVIREKIAKIENRLNSPQINSLIKILEPQGYTIKIVPIEKEKSNYT